MSEMVMAPLIVSKPSDDKALVTITLRSSSMERRRAPQPGTCNGEVFCISHSWHDRSAILDVLVEVMVHAGLLEVWRDSARDVAVVWADNEPPPPMELPRLPRVFVTDPWHPAALLSIAAEAESVIEQDGLALIAVPLCRDRVARFVIAVMRQLKLRGLVLEAKDGEVKLWIDTRAVPNDAGAEPRKTQSFWSKVWAGLKE